MYVCMCVGVGERTREGNDLYHEMIEGGMAVISYICMYVCGWTYLKCMYVCIRCDQGGQGHRKAYTRIQGRLGVRTDE